MNAPRTVLARVHRSIVDGEVVDVSLQLIRDETTVQLDQGDEFVTVQLQVDPWEHAG